MEEITSIPLQKELGEKKWEKWLVIWPSRQTDSTDDDKHVIFIHLYRVF